MFTDQYMNNIIRQFVCLWTSTCVSGVIHIHKLAQYCFFDYMKIQDA